MDLEPYGVVERGNERPRCLRDVPPPNYALPAGSRPAFLALSGGGAWGAYGAGLLVGWSEAGTRPEFRTVTGVSTGALIATFAFLGPRYDGYLSHFYTKLGNSDIYRGRSLLKVFTGDAMHDTAPLRALIDEYITPKVLDEVAFEYGRGRRLYVGTTNMDRGEFVVWDLGAIASSEHPDRLQRYRDVLQASSALPGFFPPVYIPVEHEGKRFYQMHTDVVSTTLFFRSRMLWESGVPCREGASSEEATNGDLYAVVNWRLAEPERESIPTPTTIEITMLSMTALHRWALEGSLYELSELSRAHALRLHETHVPREFRPGFEPMDFQTAGMRKLFEYGRSRGKAGDGFERLVE